MHRGSPSLLWLTNGSIVSKNPFSPRMPMAYRSIRPPSEYPINTTRLTFLFRLASLLTCSWIFQKWTCNAASRAYVSPLLLPQLQVFCPGCQSDEKRNFSYYPDDLIAQYDLRHRMYSLLRWYRRSTIGSKKTVSSQTSLLLAVTQKHLQSQYFWNRVSF